MKKRVSKKRLFLKILVALTVLSSMLVSTLFGVSKAEYFKSMSNKLDVELTPDLDLEYYLYDASVIDGASSTFTGEYGVYKNSNSFSQVIIPGKPDNKVTLSGQNGDVYYADRVVYQIKIPVDKTGYYTLDFNSYFSRVDSNGTSSSEFYTINAKYCVGCEIVTDTDIVAGSSYDKFGSSDNWSMPYRVYGVDDATKKTNNIHKLIYTDNVINGGNVDSSDTVYQWKTLAPSRYENVKLTFKVTTGDVNKGYVVWCWDLTGLESAGYQYTLHVDSLKVTKTMNLDGTTEHRTLNDPYFIFPQTAYSNNYFESNSNGAGSNHYANGRGSYVYEATDNSLGMRAEILYDVLNGEDSVKKQNPLSLYIPLKNIKYDKTYKVTFDFSVAKQGSNSVDNAIASKRNWHDYDDFANIFRSGTDKITTLDSDGRACWSYLYSYPQNSTDVLYRQSYSGHKDFMGQISYANKTYGQYTSGQYTYGYPLTKYDEVTDGFENGYTTSTSVNDTYSKNELTENSAQGIYKSQSRNWFNAIEHTEYNGQYKVNWITFYNTTFSFNIPKADNTDVDLDNLYWVWMIDILKYTAFYNIRIDNVRIEEVVEYGSGFNLNGVKIGGVQLDQTIHSDNHDASNANGSDLKGGVRGTFAAFRGMTGTGQNFQSKRNILDAITSPTSKQFFTNSANIYSPIIDASRFTVADSTQGTPYKIELSGYAVCKGGVSKYVYSLDGGNTWHDMTFSGGNASNSELTNASNSINQYASGQSVYKSEDFTWTSTDSRPTHEECTHSTLSVFDTINGSFSDWSLSVDLSAYKHQANLDVIIAAVPETNTNLRCEILRIINFNQIRNYMTFPFDFVSDIKVKVGSNQSPLNVNRLDESSAPGEHGHYYDDRVAPEATGFTSMRTWILNNGSGGSGPSSSTGYARIASNSYAYEDIRTLYSDMPVKTTLGLTGWAIVEGGVDAYYWSADHGKNWVPCTSMNTTTNVGTDAANPMTRSLISPAYKMYYYDGVAFDDSKPADKDLKTNHCFRDSIDGQFNGGGNNKVSANDSTESGDMITANLSAYVGQCVDVIFAAKPNESDVYVPVGRIDNVAVYGETGTFYTHINSLTIDGKTIEPTYFDVDDKPLNHVTSGGTVAPQWNLGYTVTGGKEFSYTIFEPNNVNAINSRLYNNKLNVVQSGSQIVINGYTAIGGAAHDNEYMYTLDGGDTWNKIYLKNNVDPTDAVKTYAKLSDSSFTNFNFANYYDDSTGNLTFAIPALPDGAVRNLTVVAKNAEGNIVPVLNIKLKIKNENVGYYLFNGNESEGSKNGYYSNNALITQSFTTNSSPANMCYKMTFPVSREGVHTLTFNADLKLSSPSASTTSATNTAIWQMWETKKTQVGTGTVSMSVEKTDFIEGEDILVAYKTDVTAGKANNNANDVSTLNDALICITRLDDNEQVVKCEDNTYAHYERAVYIVQGPDHITTTTTETEKRSGVVNLTTGLKQPDVEPNKDYSCNYTNLPAGKYRIYFVNDLKYGYGHIVHGEQSYLQLTPPIDITIHSADEYSDKIATAVLHEKTEKGGERYFASSETDRSKGGTVDRIACKTLDNAFTAQDVEFYFNATAEDVRRGYVVLDWDLSELTKNTGYTLNIKNLLYSYGVKSTKHLTTDKDGKAWYTIKVPALEVGTHEFAFSSYTSAYTPIIHKGIDQTVVKGNSNRKYGGNYLAAGAYMSVQKNFYMVGEPIHVSYNTAGAGTSYKANSLNSPWIGITRAVEGRDVIVGRLFLEKNTVGALTFKSGLDGCETVTESFADLPAGDYKLYFRDDSALIYADTHTTTGAADNLGEYWPQMNITDPIAITIIDPNRKNDNPYKQTYSFDDVRYDWTGKDDNFYSGVSGYISLDKTVFHVGEDITFNYNKSEAFGNPANDQKIYIGFAEPNYTGESFLNTSGVYFGNLEDRKIDIPDNIAPGRYQLYCCDYGFAEARQKGSVIAVIDIVILPADGENSPTMDLTYAHQSGNSALNYIYTPISAYDYSRNPISIEVTEDDVKRGYVEFKYELNNLVPNMDIVYTTEMFYNRKIEDEPYIKDGNYIYFGEYPQSLKLPSVEILENVAPDYRGYYKGSDGYYYAKVVANPYGDDYIFANGKNYVVEGKTYYFKVEPIKWRILKKSSGYYDLLCESIIDNRAYDDDSNKYDVSDVRKWLNETFYKTAFSDFQKEYIMETTVDNSLASTGYAENNYTCENTYDKVYLPSYADVTKNEYGFSSDGYEIDLNRIKTVTDYARATGAWINMSEWDGNMGSGIWMLRSPADSSSIFIREGYYIGDVTDGGINISSTAHGVVPMIRLATSLGETYDIKYSTSSNFAVEKSAFIYKPAGSSSSVTNYAGSKLSLPSIYFEYGQPIMATYKVLKTENTPRIIITKEIRNNRGILTGKDIFATCCIKYTNLSANSEGRIDINNISYHENPFIQNNPGAYEGKLPVGTYKVWFIDDDEDDDKTFLNDEDFAKDPFRKAAPQMITEPITIKVIDPENPDFSIMAESYAPYKGTGDQSEEINNNTRIILEKAVFTQGEKIHFHVENDYSFRHVMITHSTSSNVTSTYEPTEGDYTTTNQGKTWQYAKHGVFDIGDTGASNTLDTSGLNPGQYRIYYLMSKNIQAAYRGDRFYHSEDPSLSTYATDSKMFTIIDIIILPKDATQTLTVTYTKYDGTTATITESFPMAGKPKGTEFYNDKTVTIYHSGIDFVKTVTDAQPGTSFVFTVTTNFNATIEGDEKYFKERFTYTVLKKSE